MLNKLKMSEQQALKKVFNFFTKLSLDIAQITSFYIDE